LKFLIKTKALAAVLSLLIFATNCVFANTIENNFWKERSKKIELAALPASLNSNLGPKSLLNKLPAMNQNLAVTPKWSDSKGKKYLNLSKRFQTLIDSIPLGKASIREVYDSKEEKNPPVVLIQDVHLNTEAQSNIAAVLQSLIDQQQVGLVGVEGAFEPFDFKPFRTLPDKKIVHNVTSSFFNKNLLAAPSYVGITSPTEPPLFVGVDDKKHYEANVEAYLSSRGIKEKISERIYEREQNLHTLKKKVFSVDLMRFDQLQQAYHKGNLGIGAYVKNLSAHGVETDLMVDQFLEAYEMESTLNFNEIGRERRVVIEKLTKVLNEKEISTLMTQSLAYRMGRLSFGMYYQGLKNLCQQKGVNLNQAPAFNDYIRYVLLSDGIKAGLLFEAIENLKNQILATLITTPEQKQLVDASEHLALTKKLIDFSLTPKEWKRYKSTKSNNNVIPAKAGIQVVNKLLKQVRDLDPGLRRDDAVLVDGYLKAFENFYEQADIRSHKMVENLMGQTTQENKILVLGGFHTPLVSKILRQQKVSFVVVSPKITKVERESGSSYLSVFSREKTPLDQLFSGNKLFLKPRATEIEASIGAKMLGSILARLGIWRDAVKARLEFTIHKVDVDLIVKKAPNPADDQYQLKRKLRVVVKEFAYRLPVFLLVYIHPDILLSFQGHGAAWILTVGLAYRFAMDHQKERERTKAEKLSEWKIAFIFMGGLLLGGVFLWPGLVANRALWIVLLSMSLHLGYLYLRLWARNLAEYKFVINNIPLFVQFAHWWPAWTIEEDPPPKGQPLTSGSKKITLILTDDGRFLHDPDKKLYDRLIKNQSFVDENEIKMSLKGKAKLRIVDRRGEKDELVQSGIPVTHLVLQNDVINGEIAVMAASHKDDPVELPEIQIKPIEYKPLTEEELQEENLEGDLPSDVAEQEKEPNEDPRKLTVAPNIEQELRMFLTYEARKQKKNKKENEAGKKGWAEIVMSGIEKEVGTAAGYLKTIVEHGEENPALQDIVRRFVESLANQTIQDPIKPSAETTKFSSTIKYRFKNVVEAENVGVVSGSRSQLSKALDMLNHEGRGVNIGG